jgi:hypothetical protein
MQAVVRDTQDIAKDQAASQDVLEIDSPRLYRVPARALAGTPIPA